jgi:hypothetical protein
MYKGVDYSDENRVNDRRFKKHRVRPRKVFRVSRIWELHDEIARRVLLGQKNKVIAEALSCSVATVSNVRNSPVIQDKLAIMRGARDAYTVDIARDIQEFAPKALELLKDIVMGKGVGANASPALRAREANAFLDRAGHGAVRKEAHIHQHLTTEEIEAIKERALGANGPKVVDAEYTDNLN